jgi:hypothetical protein
VAKISVWFEHRLELDAIESIEALGQMMRIVVIASSTRGFATPRDGTPARDQPVPKHQRSA